jgi:hypothetical protein
MIGAGAPGQGPPRIGKILYSLCGEAVIRVSVDQFYDTKDICVYYDDPESRICILIMNTVIDGHNTRVASRINQFVSIIHKTYCTNGVLDQSWSSSVRPGQPSSSTSVS